MSSPFFCPSSPRVEKVTSSLADGTYGPGQILEIFVKFTVPVTVVGSPWLLLDLGDTEGIAEYDSMKNGTDDTLRFVYVVREGSFDATRLPVRFTRWVEEIEIVLMIVR